MTATTTTTPANAQEQADRLARLAAEVQTARAEVDRLVAELATTQERRRRLPELLAETLDTAKRALLRQERHTLDEAAEELPIRQRQASEALRAATVAYAAVAGRLAADWERATSAELAELDAQATVLRQRREAVGGAQTAWIATLHRATYLERAVQAVDAAEVAAVVRQHFPLHFDALPAAE